MNCVILRALRVYLIFIILTFLLVPLVSAGNYCPHDELKDSGEDDVEWVEFGSGNLPWGKTTLDSEYSGDQIEITVPNGSDGSGEKKVLYVLKVNDFDLARTQVDVSISVAKTGAEAVRKILILDGEDYSWFQLDHELKVELTDITEDGDGTPHAKFEYYERGKPEFEIDIDSDSETYNDISIDEDEYFPGREKEITVTVKNAGDGWVECIDLEVDIEGFELAESKHDLQEKDIQKKNSRLFADLGWLDEDEERSINFTVRAPEWNGVTSPFDMNLNITALASGEDILGYVHEGNETLDFKSVSPDGISIRQKLSVYSLPQEKVNQANRRKLESGSAGGLVELFEDDELYMSSWYIKDAVVHGLRDYCIIKDSVYNLEYCTINNLTFKFSAFPEGLLVAEAYKNGKPVLSGGDSNNSSSSNIFENGVSICIPGQKDYDTLEEIVPLSLESKDSYSLTYILIPTKPGEYKIQSFSATADCYGYNFSETSDSVSFTVHGPEIAVTKSIEASEDGQVNVAVRVKNNGDRAASVNLSDQIPSEAGLVKGSLEVWHNGKLEESDMPLDEWNLETDSEDSFTPASLAAKLAPDEYYDLKYSITPASLDTLDLPYAEAYFLDRNFYEGTVRSSFFKSGAEVQQQWDYYENSWEITSENWDASAADWEEGWDPIKKQWAEEEKEEEASSKVTSPAESSETALEEETPSSSEPLEEQSLFEKIKGTIKGLFSFLPFLGEDE